MERLTAARPYARAIFALAQDVQQFDTWQSFLENLAHLYENDLAADFLKNPLVSKRQRKDFLRSMLTSYEAQMLAVLDVLVDTNRLALINDILAQFNVLTTALRHHTTALVESAWPLTLPQQEQIVALIQRILKLEVHLELKSVPELIGGFRIIIGHWVLDASVKRQIKQLTTTLCVG